MGAGECGSVGSALAPWEERVAPQLCQKLPPRVQLDSVGSDPLVRFAADDDPAGLRVFFAKRTEPFEMTVCERFARLHFYCDIGLTQYEIDLKLRRSAPIAEKKPLA